MKNKSLMVLLLSLSLICGLASTFCQAGDKEEFQLKARALIAEANLAQSNIALWQMRGNEAQKAIQEFVKELDARGFMATPEGMIVEKPQPVEPKKEEVIPPQPQPKPKK